MCHYTWKNNTSGFTIMCIYKMRHQNPDKFQFKSSAIYVPLPEVVVAV